MTVETKVTVETLETGVTVTVEIVETKVTVGAVETGVTVARDSRDWSDRRDSRQQRL